MSKFECYVCSDKCGDFCIYCETCQTWSHYRCQDIDRCAREKWRNTKLPYICIRCRTNDDDSFDYLMGLERLRQASKQGIQKLKKAAEREILFLKNVPIIKSLYAHFDTIAQDETANTLLRYFHASDKVALNSSTDGDCLFNSVSILLAGNESRATELRYRCCIEMTTNKSKIMIHPQFKRLTVICPPFEQDCLHCATPGQFSSMHMCLALSILLNITFHVLYPAVNGSNNYNFKTMNTVFQPPFADKDEGSLTVMWTSVNLPVSKPTTSEPWHANHFVPLVDSVQKGPIKSMSNFFKDDQVTQNDEPTYIEQPLPRVNLPDANIDQDVGSHLRDAALCVPTSDNGDMVNHYVPDLSVVVEEDDTPLNLSESDALIAHDVGSHLLDAALCAPTSDNDDTMEDSQTAITEVTGKSEEEFSTGPLSKFMDVTETMCVYQRPYAIMDEIPVGVKDGYYFVVDNRKNVERKRKGLRSEFWDDCGAWGKGTSPAYNYIYKNTKMVVVVRKNGEYCVERMKNKQRIFEQLQPQPSDDEILVIRRLYNSLTASSNFKRRCTWIAKAPSSMPQLSTDIAIVEYIGTFPGRIPHQRNKDASGANYIRTKPEVCRHLKDQLKYASVKTVEQNMNKKTSDDYSKQRNDKQLRNFKYNANKTEQKPSNVADQIIYVEEMVKTHEFVYSVKHMKGNVHPVVTLMTDQQIIDLKRFCGTGRTVLGVDKTYNLGDFFVTPTVFKDLSVLRRTTKQHPITFGPTFIHTNSSGKTYSSFIHDIADNLTEQEIHRFVIGSDEEKAFKVAIERCFPGATHTFCTRHLRQNTTKYLEDMVGYPKTDRQKITEAIYGEDGIVASQDVDTMNHRVNAIKTMVAKLDNTVGDKKFMPYFSERLVPILQKYVITPVNSNKVPLNWTNNNCESANHILKTATNWKATDLPSFIALLYDVICSEQTERCRAIRGNGNYMLDHMFDHHRIDIDKWANMSQPARDQREKKFKSDKGRENANVVVSTNGLRTVQRTPSAGRKPNQIKRKRAERSRTPKAKRALIVVEGQ